MNEDKGPRFSRQRADEIGRTHDAIQRARAASPVTGGSDRLSGLKSFLGRDRA